MPGKLYLIVEDGPNRGKRFGFQDAMMCIIGRDEECTLQLTSDFDPQVSRHHCALGINPPYMSVRDLGSSNGTFVNDKRVESDQDYNLREGDVLTIGNTNFRFKVKLPLTCDACGGEILESEKSEAMVGEGNYVCVDCQQKDTEKLGGQTQPIAVCSKCGRALSLNGTDAPAMDYICPVCRLDGVHQDSPYEPASLPNETGMAYCCLGNIELKEKLGEGGMGAVYLATDSQGRDVAVKLLLPELSTSRSAVRSFMREIKNTSILEHPNIIRLHEIAMESDTVYFTMEYCNAGNLQKYVMHRKEPLKLRQAMDLFAQILNAIDFAHNKKIPGKSLLLSPSVPGIIHRDLKPGNVFLHKENGSLVPKVGDFGISKALTTTGLGNSTCTGTAFGTPAFMPKQQVTDFKDAGPGVDIWAATAILYFMLTQRTPRHIDGHNPLQSLLNNRTIPIQSKNSAIPKELADFIDTALDDSVRLKYNSVDELKTELIRIL